MGTLESGESQAEASRRSVRDQTHPEVDRVVIRDLPNREAHRKLYRTFMEEAESYDLFVKLDADMVLTRSSALSEIAEVFRRDPAIDHAVFPVGDWCSRRLIEGLHVFSDRARWSGLEDDLFVDPGPEIPGRTAKPRTGRPPLARHAPDPTPYEAFRFGVHRGLKLVQRDRARFRAHQFWLQGRVLDGCWRHFRESGDRRPGLAALGAELVLRGEIGPSEYGRAGDALRSRWREVAGLGPGELRDRLSQGWEPAVRRRARWVLRAGPGRLALGTLRMLAYRGREAVTAGLDRARGDAGGGVP